MAQTGGHSQTADGCLSVGGCRGVGRAGRQCLGPAPRGYCARGASHGSQWMAGPRVHGPGERADFLAAGWRLQIYRNCPKAHSTAHMHDITLPTIIHHHAIMCLLAFLRVALASGSKLTQAACLHLLLHYIPLLSSSIYVQLVALGFCSRPRDWSHHFQKAYI